jgi:MscS family membrane protein
MRRNAILLLAAFFVLLLPSQAKTQEPSYALNSPASTIKNFAALMSQDRPAQARKALDLSDIAFPVRDTEAPRYARLLLSVLARIPASVLDQVPDTFQGSQYAVTVPALNGQPLATLMLERHAAGAWQFSAATVSALPRTFQLVESLPQRSNLGYVSDPAPEPSMEARAVMPSALLHPLLWLEVWQWFAILLLLAVAWVIARIVRLLVGLALRIFLRPLYERLAPVSMRSLKRASGIIAATAFCWDMYPYMGLGGTWLLALIVLLKMAWIAGVSWLIAALVDILMDSLGARASALVQRADHILIPIARKFAKFVVFVGATLVFAASMDVNVAGLVAGLGIGGLVVALAAKDSVENIFGSLTILFDMPFGIGDWIKMGEVEGVAEEINLRSTRIRTFQDTVITLPNSNLIKASVDNFGARRYRRLNFTLGLSYVNDFVHIRQFCEAARAVLVGNEKVRADNAYVVLNTLTENSMGMLIQCYLLTTDYGEELQIREEILTQIVSLAAEKGVLLGPMPWMPATAPSTAGASGITS